MAQFPPNITFLDPDDRILLNTISNPQTQSGGSRDVVDRPYSHRCLPTDIGRGEHYEQIRVPVAVATFPGSKKI